MAGSKDVTIRAQALDGTWTVIGGERARGVYPEGVTLEADVWGSSRASFTLRRDPRAFLPDIGAFTPVEIDVGSSLVWSGRVSETPSRVAQRVVSVQCEGWQYHLDDDVYQRLYVNTKLGDWKDARSSPTCPLGSGGGQYAVGWQVNNGDGAIVITKPNGFNPGSFTRAGILLDGGSAGAIARLTGTYDTSGAWGGTSSLYAASGDTAAAALSASPSGLATVTAGSGQTFRFSPTPARYVLLFVDSNGTPAADEWIRFTQLLAWGSTAWESSFTTSLLKASDVATDAMQRATVLLSSDLSQITATSFGIPECVLGVQTPRQAWTAVDAYHDWLKQIDVQRRPVYKAKPARPIFEVGAWSAIDDDDASANSGQEIYNRAIITGQTPDGQALSVSRPTAMGLAGPLFASASPAAQNQSADVNAAGWSWTGAQAVNLVRDTTIFNTAPGSIHVTVASAPSDFMGSGQQINAAMTGATFRAGVTYVAQVVLRADVGTRTLSGDPAVSLLLGASAAASSDVSDSGSVTVSRATFQAFEVRWVPLQDTAAANVVFRVTTLDSGQFPNGYWVDDLRLYTLMPTLVDRRNFRRTMQLPVSSALPAAPAAANVIADVWLDGHKTTPFRGSLTLSGSSSLREILTGRDVGLEQLLLNTGQMLRFSDRTDPDTGGHGKDGRITSVIYTPAADTAQLTLDNSRTSFPALLARLAVIQGG